jgi:hypothetical protein
VLHGEEQEAHVQQEAQVEVEAHVEQEAQVEVEAHAQEAPEEDNSAGPGGGGRPTVGQLQVS